VCVGVVCVCVWVWCVCLCVCVCVYVCGVCVIRYGQNLAELCYL